MTSRLWVTRGDVSPSPANAGDGESLPVENTQRCVVSVDLSEGRVSKVARHIAKVCGWRDLLLHTPQLRMKGHLVPPRQSAAVLRDGDSVTILPGTGAGALASVTPKGKRRQQRANTATSAAPVSAGSVTKRAKRSKAESLSSASSDSSSSSENSSGEDIRAAIGSASMMPGKSAANGATMETAKPLKKKHTAAASGALDAAAQQTTGVKKKRKRGERGGRRRRKSGAVDASPNKDAELQHASVAATGAAAVAQETRPVTSTPTVAAAGPATPQENRRSRRASAQRKPLGPVAPPAVFAPAPTYEGWPEMSPSMGAHVAFKLVQLSAAYTPEISAYYEGVVTAMDDAAISFRLLKPAPPPPQGDEESRGLGKFDVDDEEPGDAAARLEAGDTLEVQLTEVYQIRQKPVPATL